MCIIIATLLLLCLCKILKPVLYERMLQPMITHYWSIPRRIHKIMKDQRVPGPSLVNVATNSLNKLFQRANSNNIHNMSSINHDIVGPLFPHHATWTAKYGRTFFFSNWVEPRMCLTEAKHIKELLFRYSSDTRNTGLGTKFFIGQGVSMKELGLDLRLTLQTVFNQSKIQEWVSEMVECTEIMLQQLQDKVDGNDQIEISQYVNVLITYIMSRTEFGTSSEQGKQIAQLLNKIQEMRAQSSWHSRFSPISQYNKELQALQVQVENLLRLMIQQRVHYVEIGRTNSHGNDLLGILLDEMRKKMGFINMDLIVDECKTSFFAGHEANTHLITWTLMLLASNPSWQRLVRAEVNNVCNGEPPTARKLSTLGMLNMVIKESLRLYPPVPVIERRACNDIRIHHSLSGDNFLIPKGSHIWIPILAINHSEELWGRDVNEFNPQRFAFNNSVEARRHFFPFAAGPRHCPAQYFALMEAKIFLAMFISKFSFTISQNYRHEPVVVPLLKPKYGVQINLTRL